MKKLLSLFLLLLVVPAVALADAEFIPANETAITKGGTGTTNVGAATLFYTTNALPVLGATRVAYILYAATGRDSSILVQVSQDSTNWSAGVLVPGAPSASNLESIVCSGNACSDSLRLSPTVIVDNAPAFATYNGTVGATPSIPSVYRYMRLKIYPYSAIPQTNLLITPMRFYGSGEPSQFQRGY